MKYSSFCSVLLICLSAAIAATYFAKSKLISNEKMITEDDRHSKYYVPKILLSETSEGKNHNNNNDNNNRALQVIGRDICSCAPNTYEFTLDFSLFCPPVNITQGDAVASTTCLVNPFIDPDAVDLIPVSVQQIDILELNQNLRLIVQETIEGDFVDGDTFSYTSYAADPSQIQDPVDVPRAIQLNIIGRNQFDETIINLYLILFTNDCMAYPVLFEGQSAGWTRFSDLGSPRQELCPFGGTPAPTAGPTLPPTPGTPAPTAGPTLPPTPGTPAPTAFPTLPPTPDPTTPSPTTPEPSPEPTQRPTPPRPTQRPTPEPTPSPTPQPTLSSSIKSSKKKKKKGGGNTKKKQSKNDADDGHRRRRI